MTGFDIREGVPYVNDVAIGGAYNVHNGPASAATAGLFTLRGFHVDTTGGWTLSVQWGTGNYCEARDDHEGSSSATAEIAVWRRKEPMVTWPDGDTVQGWVEPEVVLALLLALARPLWTPASFTRGLD